ncbi:MAG: hypothetical protein LBD92_05235 [Oscillospiraceae bacterium]|jgi:hypothetical protein|nr:hypothetical protein [Oscillospiraceae bacterium]
MIKLLRGEAYRILRKKRLYVFFAALAVGYVLVAYVRSGGFSAESILGDTRLFILLPPLAGGVLFSTIYLDDLSSKNLATLIGFGVGKAKIAAAKLILTALFAAVVYALAPLLLYAAHAALGFPATAGVMALVCAMSLKQMLTTVAFSALSGAVAYGLQKKAAAMVAYILLAFGVVSQLAGLLLRTEFVSGVVPGLDRRLMPDITDRIITGLTGGVFPVGAVVEYVVYVLAALALSALALDRREMEF